ncbi:MAG: bifunctional diaminohydroxyphosphoribosylaminopyrimidine deaminase/5-amino-6-(5-phosphoribosylamino)uracil reductase RibD [Woeseiaceae bacterium]
MSQFDSADHTFMALALRLAENGRYSAHPNPRVGCVLVKAGEVIGTGWHRKTGEAHAEANALREAGAAAAGSTAYVTLEPCAHDGKTPPCARALIDAGVANVVAAMQDPYPKVAGIGCTQLQEAGVNVRVGLMSSAAEALNAGYLSRVRRGRPFVRLKIAASLDGRTAMASGESQWITGAAARRDVQLMRASSGAVLSGINTVLADDPSLTVRDTDECGDFLQPLRVIVDSTLRMPPSARMLSLKGETLVFCIADENRSPLEDHGAEVVMLRAQDGRPDLTSVLEHLGKRGINDVLVEAGPTLAGGILTHGLVDELVIYQAPHIMGSETRGMVATPMWHALNQRLDLEILDTRRIGADLRITAKPL